MFHTVRVRLALSYAGIALLVTLSLGAVLLVRLRAYTARMERETLYSNARAISALAAPMLVKRLPMDVQEAQAGNLAFLSQARVRILDVQNNVLVDSGPWQSTRIGFGVVRGTGRVAIAAGGDDGALPASAAVMLIMSRPTDELKMVFEETSPTPPLPEREGEGAPGYPGTPGGAETAREIGKAGGAQAGVEYFSAAVPVTSGVYGLYLSSSNGQIMVRSSQVVQQPITDPLGFPLGTVELSESPAYGQEIIRSVASALAVAGGLAILLAVGVGWLASRQITAPLLRLTEATQQMSSGDLSVRVVEAERKDEFGALGKSFNHMAGRIEETVQTLRRFLADAAHELNTPLTALRTNLELARELENGRAAGAYLAQALEQIERLQRMMRDLLCLSRLESAAAQEAFQPVDLAELVRQASEPFAARAEQAGQSFYLDLAAGDARVMGSPEKLRSALGNLLDNACKFTPPGGMIAVRLCEMREEICATVSDSGIGIPPGEIDLLYNRFHRARNASAYPGSGLGLAIVRAVAQAHGGSVRAANNPGGGACFTLRLPRIPAISPDGDTA